MAEIRVEERRRSLSWLWALIALVIVALLIWFFMAGAGNDVDTIDPTLPEPGASLTEPQPVVIPRLVA